MSSHIDVTKGMEALREPTIKKVAIANPKHAPYGRAAAWLRWNITRSMTRSKTSSSWERISSQAAQFIESGACDIGIIALSSGGELLP